jgi:hypothetical protein
MNSTSPSPAIERRDWLFALGVALLALVAYIRTLAPDVLYSDSAEFQTLAYTLGTTHSTGYPVYLLLARLVGFLPLRTPAWRVNLFSALSAAVTVGGVYLLTRFVARRRLAAVLGSLALALSYTFWSQAIIAEVYTPGTAFLIAILLLLAHWQYAPVVRRGALFLAAALTCLSLGVHAYVVLIAPAAVVFVIGTLWLRRVSASARCLRAAAVGFLVGLGLYFLAFVALDLNNPPSSFIRVMLYPSRSVWGLEATDLDGVFERWWLTVSGVQWQNVMFPEDESFIDSLSLYLGRVVYQEFSPLLVVFALVSLNAHRWLLPKRAADFTGNRPVRTDKKPFTLDYRKSLGAFMLLALLVMLAFVLNYYPGDKYIFYLPTYLLIAVAIGAGIDRVLGWVGPPPEEDGRWYHKLYPVVVLLLVVIVLRPHLALRRQAIEAGKATFVQHTYPYPVENLEEPRQLTQIRLTLLPEDAFLVMNWRALYTTYYLAHVEGMRPQITIKEATPHGSDGRIADTLLQEMEETARAGRPVIVDQVYPGLRDRFRVMPAPGGRMYRLTIPDADN